jgi:hypothetical protein
MPLAAASSASGRRLGTFELKLHSTPYVEHLLHCGLVSSHYNVAKFGSVPCDMAFTKPRIAHLEFSELAIPAAKSRFPPSFALVGFFRKLGGHGCLADYEYVDLQE